MKNSTGCLTFASLAFFAALTWSSGGFAASKSARCEPQAFPDMPTPRLSLAAAVSPDGRIFAIGGSTASILQTLDVVEAYDPATQTWATMSPMPTARSFLGTATDDYGLIYAIGGMDNAARPFDTGEIYQPDARPSAELPPT